MEIDDEECVSTNSQLHPLPQCSNNDAGDGTNEILGNIQKELDDITDIFIVILTKFSIA